MNKTEFLVTIRAKRVRLEENLAKLSETEMEHKVSLHAWSIKDSLAHLTFYERHILNNVRQAQEEEVEILGVTREEQTERNAQIFARNQDRPVVDVLNDMQNSFAQVIALIETIPEVTLTDPNRFAWLNGMPLWQYILDETSGEHYEEHLGSLMS